MLREKFPSSKRKHSHNVVDDCCITTVDKHIHLAAVDGGTVFQLGSIHLKGIRWIAGIDSMTLLTFGDADSNKPNHFRLKDLEEKSSSFPWHPCMVYVSTFTMKINNMYVNIPRMVWVLQRT